MNTFLNIYFYRVRVSKKHESSNTILLKIMTGTSNGGPILLCFFHTGLYHYNRTIGGNENKLLLKFNDIGKLYDLDKFDSSK